MADTSITLEQTPWRAQNVGIYDANVVEFSERAGVTPASAAIRTIAVTTGGSMAIPVVGTPNLTKGDYVAAATVGSVARFITFHVDP